MAGLWEFPSAAVASDSDEASRRSAIDALLSRLLEGNASGLKVKERASMGSIVHIFSHIRMTLHAERLILQARIC